MIQAVRPPGKLISVINLEESKAAQSLFASVKRLARQNTRIQTVPAGYPKYSGVRHCVKYNGLCFPQSTGMDDLHVEGESISTNAITVNNVDCSPLSGLGDSVSVTLDS